MRIPDGCDGGHRAKISERCSLGETAYDPFLFPFGCFSYAEQIGHLLVAGSEILDHGSRRW